MKNKAVKQVMAGVLYAKDFEVNGVHKVVTFDFPILTCWNAVLNKEQFSGLPTNTVSLTAEQLKK